MPWLHVMSRPEGTFTICNRRICAASDGYCWPFVAWLLLLLFLLTSSSHWLHLLCSPVEVVIIIRVVVDIKGNASCSTGGTGFQKVSSAFVWVWYYSFLVHESYFSSCFEMICRKGWVMAIVHWDIVLINTYEYGSCRHSQQLRLIGRLPADPNARGDIYQR